MDCIISSMQSGTLVGSEDEGLGKLLMLNDMISKIIEAELSVTATTPVGTSTSPPPSPSDQTSPSTNPHVTNAAVPSHLHSIPPVHTTPPDHTSSSPHPQINSTVMQSHPHSNPPVNTTTQPVEELRMLYEELGKKLRQCEATATSPAPTHSHQGGSVLYPPSQNISERVVPLKDLPYLQRREFKVHGGQIGDQSSEVSYSSISRQIEEGVREGFADIEVVRGVLRIIKPGTFKDMLSNKDDLAIPELKGFLRSHLGEKPTTEMFQELMCARQAEQESPQQFLYRMIGLKQRLLFQSKQASTDISYDPKTIQEVFLNTVYQGLGAKHTDLRQRLRPLVSNSQVTDEEILGQMTKMISDENEHQRRFGQLPRQKSSHAHSAKVETDGQSNDKSRGSAADDKNLQTIQQLSAQVETLTQMVAILMGQQVSSNQMGHSLPPLAQIQPQTTSYLHFHSTSNHTPPLPQPVCPSSHPSSQHPFQSSPKADSQSSFQARRRIVRCSKCTEEDRQECNHCFACGEAGHRAVGCLKRNRFQGNEIRSLSRDRQRPVHSPSPNQ